MQAPTTGLPHAQQHQSLPLLSTASQLCQTASGKDFLCKDPCKSFCISVECRAQDKFLLLRNQLGIASAG